MNRKRPTEPATLPVAQPVKRDDRTDTLVACIHQLRNSLNDLANGIEINGQGRWFIAEQERMRKAMMAADRAIIDSYDVLNPGRKG